MFKLSGGRWNPGPSAAEDRYTDLVRRICNTRLEGPHSVIVGSMKGGVGKTTMSALLGLCLAEHRGDRVVAVDANPDAGTLADRLVGEEFAAQVTVRDLLAHLDEVETFTDLSKYVHLTRRLQVVASDQEPESSEAFSLTDYESVVRVLSRFAQAIITDLGTGIVHSAAQGGLKHCDSLVIVGTLTQDGASRAQRTLDYLANYRDTTGSFPHRHLVNDAVVVLSGDRWSESIDADVIRDYFRGRVRAVLELPADRHLASGGPIDLALLQPATRAAVLEIAATVADGFYGRATHGLASHGFRGNGHGSG
ncbi:MinD/ParA family protein [Pseudonocardia sp. ICBG601]|uniref:MinD/ParA family ATP-binding protein n=1 Tax=Pseudonocardia sp. ICBG601 TaxID=2846759 RepID=UPI001CF61465|nr:MinD/ParA family protein [Pseudonocardia sp. ICBG601]